MYSRVALAMVAFAANSVLCRLALHQQHIDPVSFSGLRIAGGALIPGLMLLGSRTRRSLYYRKKGQAGNRRQLSDGCAPGRLVHTAEQAWCACGQRRYSAGADFRRHHPCPCLRTLVLGTAVSFLHDGLRRPVECAPPDCAGWRPVHGRPPGSAHHRVCRHYSGRH